MLALLRPARVAL